MICDVALQHAKRCAGSRLPPDIRDIPPVEAHCRNDVLPVRKEPISKSGFRPCFQATKYFQHQTLLVNHRAVALLCVHYGWRKQTLRGLPERLQRGVETARTCPLAPRKETPVAIASSKWARKFSSVKASLRTIASGKFPGWILSNEGGNRAVRRRPEPALAGCRRSRLVHWCN